MNNIFPYIHRETQVKSLQEIKGRNEFVKNISRVLFLLCFFCILLPKTSSATNPAVIINEGMNIQISVSMSKVSGDNQQAQAGATLPQALVVKVSYTNGTGVANLPINFAITQQPQGATSARLSANQVTTNSSGQAQVTLTLGDKSGQYQVSASNPNVSNSPVVFTATAIGGGEPGEYVKDENPDLPIRDLQTTISTLNVPDSIKISAVEVYVDITHTWIGDLIVTLISPSGKQHILHNRTGSSQDNIIAWYKGISTFMSEEARGNWQLKVEDKAGEDQGSLNLWKIRIIPETSEEWKTYNYIVESPHPYPDNYTYTWIITHPGASKMRVHFEKYSIEGDYIPYDKLYILDKNNNEVIWYSGYNKTDIWSPVVLGDVIKLKLVTDRSDTAYGFRVDKYQAVGGTPLPLDTTPPSKITNLTASAETMNSIKLTWTAPGDDGHSGQATSYDIRYSTSMINDTNWASATQVQNKPIPAVAGTAQNMTISNLQVNTLYYFGIKTSDEAENISELSNIASLRTKGPEDIEVGGEKSGRLDNRNYIWYRLYLASQMQVVIILTMDSSVDYDLQVYSGDANSSGAFITSSYQGSGKIDKCSIDRSGYIWIKVYHYSGRGDYRLKVEEPRKPPQDWITTDYVVESPHNYPNNYDNTWTITQPGAGTISVHFSRLETEQGWDYVYIYDKNNNEIDRYDGYYTNIWTPPVPGDTIKIRLKTDDSVTRWGFKVDKYACPIQIIITQVTPSNNNISFTTQPPENRIQCIADIKPDSLDATYNSQIEWEIDDDPRDNHQSGNPNDTERGNDVHLQITIPPVPIDTNGRGFPLSYRIKATVTINSTTYISMATYTTQDNLDGLRQEYIDVERNGQRASRIPNRNEYDQDAPAYPRLLDRRQGYEDICAWHQWWILRNLNQHARDLDNAYAGNLLPTSGYRCPVENPGASNSHHLFGRALDFDQGSSRENYNVAREARNMGGLSELILYDQHGAEHHVLNNFPPLPPPNYPPGVTAWTRGHVAW